MFDGGEFGRQMAAEVKTAIAPLTGKIAALEAKIAALSERQIKYLGIHKPGATYSEGSLVTRDGSVFHANKTTSEMPGDGNQDWILAIKRGRDGRDAK
jgi:hypothetical protein